MGHCSRIAPSRNDASTITTPRRICPPMLGASSASAALSSAGSVGERVEWARLVGLPARCEAARSQTMLEGALAAHELNRACSGGA